jgi:DNA-binding transcriptional LysR family regulator
MASLENFRLIVFRAVAEHKSFRKAAEELFLTQPAVSLQIKALEEEMGVQLFHRGGAQIELTAAGEILLRSARQAGALLREAEAEIAALSGGFSGRLALGASTTIVQYVLPRLLGAFLQTHPRVNATLISGNTEAVVDALTARKIALGLIEGPARNREVKTVPFLLDELVLIVPSGSAWGEDGEIGAPELAKLPLLLRERGSGTRRIVELALARGGLKRGALRVAM